ncbi:nickel ABC transporter permease subunit NikC [Nonomuraea africana]|uniref:Peptide/nickel transport system permease protein n=1 Tax=Nonomuraea africana TaxID=46171 RepID=A0ABR9K9S3_9ACTN|nr:ABC transporter permease [Nonomuraea africana]MBE1558655.1 peptide/nickel transport system permease protein [Nonomuraea africana]
MRASLIAGTAAAALLAVLAVAGPWALPDPDVPDYAAKLLPPGAAHPLGTDQLGRDVLARLASGARVTLGAALAVTALGAAIGIVAGGVAGYARGVVDAAISRVVDVLLAVPSTLVALAVVGALGPGLANLVLAMSVAAWAPVARLTRSHVLTSAARPDVIAARMAGIGRGRIVLGHVLPGAFLRVLAVAALGLGETIIGLSGLSFLGLGAQPPTAEWGQMLAESRYDLASSPWLLAGPGVAILLAVTAAGLLSDALRERL